MQRIINQKKLKGESIRKRIFLKKGKSTKQKTPDLNKPGTRIKGKRKIEMSPKTENNISVF